MENKIAQVVVGLPIEGPFDYLLDAPLADKARAGARVRVSFGPRQKIGMIVGFAAKSRFAKLKPISALIDTVPVLDENFLKLTKEFSEYYGCSWGEAIETSLVLPLRKGKPVELTAAQEGRAALSAESPETVLLHDHGRVKRWPYIMERVKKAIAAGRGVIFLVPEANLVDGVCLRLKETGVDIAVWDKRSKPAAELKEWTRVKAGEVRMVAGSRSAVFAPVRNLGLIVVYDEENSAYKQEQVPAYHTRDVAMMRARIEGADLLFVSSAPSAELWAAADKKKIKLVSLVEDNPVKMHLIDLTNYNARKASLISFPLRNHIQKTLETGGKVLLFMNRRGFSTMTRCHQCGYTLRCERCDTNLTYLYAKKKMVCRHCNFTTDLPRVCPKCNSSYLHSMGTGIEKLESEVSRIIPQARVDRYDKDSPSVPENWNVLIATQAVLRLKEKLAVNLVGVIHFDSELSHMDFRCAQRAFGLLVHLRQIAVEKIMVQTRLMDNYCLKAASKMDFKYFYKNEIKLRKELGFPPFRHLVAVGLRSEKEEDVFAEANALYKAFGEKLPKGIEVTEPYPDVIKKLRDQYRFTILLKGKAIPQLLTVIKKVLKASKKKKNVIITVDVDP